MMGIVRGVLNRNAPEEKGIRGRIRRAIRSYFRWNRQLLLDPWMRYTLAVSAIRVHLRHRGALVLDVGSGPQGLARFLRRTIVGVDIGFGGEVEKSTESFLLPVRASATHLPFRDRSFDAVVSMDMLEHIPRSDRPRAVSELFRVGRSLVVLGFPFGKASQDFDETALQEEKFRGLALNWRTEHVGYRLPDKCNSRGNRGRGQVEATGSHPFVVSSGGPSRPQTALEAPDAGPKGLPDVWPPIRAPLLAACARDTSACVSQSLYRPSERSPICFIQRYPRSA